MNLRIGALTGFLGFCMARADPFKSFFSAKGEAPEPRGEKPFRHERKVFVKQKEIFWLRVGKLSQTKEKDLREQKIVSMLNARSHG